MSYLGNLARAVVGRVSQRASTFGPLIARYALGRPVWSQRDAVRQAEEGFRQNPVVHRCVELIAQGVSSIPWVPYKGAGKDAVEIEAHPLLDLLERPNAEQGRAAFIEALVSHYLVAGNAYVERTNEARLATCELYALRPDRVRVVPGPSGLPMAYEYTASGATRRIAVDLERPNGARPILHLKTFNPLDDWYGLSPLDPAGWAIDTHTEASRWNYALLRNAASPSGAFVMVPGKDMPATLSDQSFDRLKAQIDEQMSGAGNAGRPLVIEGGLDWRSMGFTPESMQHVESKSIAAREIAFALGVPPLLIGLPGDNTYANFAEANRAFFRVTVIPLAERIMRDLTRWMGPRLLGDGVSFRLNTDDLDALAVERAEQWNRLNTATFLSIDEKREAAGYTRRDIPGSDDLFIPAGMLPVNFDATIAGGPAIDVTPSDATPAIGAASSGA